MGIAESSRVLIFIAGAVLAVMAYIGERLPQNALIGIRTPATLRDKRVWRLTHRRMRPVLALGAGVFVVAGAFAPTSRVLLIAVVTYSVVLVVAGYLVVSRVKSAVASQESRPGSAD